MQSPRLLLLGVLFAALSFALSSPAMAGTKPSPDNCKAVGSAVLKCYDCRNPQKYMGKASVLTAYEEAQGEKFCVRAADGKAACSAATGVPTYGVGFYTKFSMGGGSREEFYDTNCVNNVGY